MNNIGMQGDDMPSRPARVVSLPSDGTSCDFHPFLHTLLLGELRPNLNFLPPPSIMQISHCNSPISVRRLESENFCHLRCLHLLLIPVAQLALSLEMRFCGRYRLKNAC